MSQITNADIEAVTDPAAIALADEIVLNNQGPANASVLIDRFATQIRIAARTAALEEAAKVADRFVSMTRASPLWEERTSDCLDEIPSSIRSLATTNQQEG